MVTSPISQGTSGLISRIRTTLESAGYSEVPGPFFVAKVEFRFSAAFRGRGGRSPDLVVVIDTSLADVANTPERWRQRLEALSRALDVAGSTVVLTAILAGAPIPVTAADAIAKICRVLVVSKDPSTAPLAKRASAELEFEDRLRVLLPLSILPGANLEADSLGELLKKLPTEPVREVARPLLGASSGGAKAVTKAFTDMLEVELNKALKK